MLKVECWALDVFLPFLPAPSMTETAAVFRSIRCPRCSTALAGGAGAEGVPIRCPGCQSELLAHTFRALAQPRPATVSTAGAQAAEGEAVCFFHPHKRAEQSCERCGRFICALCDMPLGTRHVCPACLGSGLAAGGSEDKLPELVTRRVRWPLVALLTGLLPLLFGWMLWPLLVISGPTAIFLAIYGWKKPGSLVYGRRRWQALLAIFFGLAQLAVLGGLVLLIWKASS
jgi:hypothetical protein